MAVATRNLGPDQDNAPPCKTTKARQLSVINEQYTDNNMYRPSKTIISIVVHAIPAILVVCFAGRILADPANAREGVIRYSFPKLLPRGFPNVPNVPNVPDVPDIPAEATKIADPVKTVGAKASEAVKKVPDVVSSAVSAVQSMASSKLPQALSVGTEYGCVTIGSEIVASDLHRLTKILNHVPSLRTMVILTVVSTLCSFFLLISKHFLPVWSGLTPLTGMVGMIFAVVVVSFTVSIAKAASQVEKVLGGKLAHGAAYQDSIAAVTCASLYVFVAVVALAFGL